MAGAEEFLRDNPWHDLTIDRVMACTTLSRPSFYVHFTDRLDLLAQLGAAVTVTLAERSDRAQWLAGEGSPATISRQAIEGLVALYREHGTLINALVEASYHETAIKEGRTEVEDRFAAATAGRIREEIAAGRAPECNADLVAQALTLLTESTLIRWYGVAHPAVAPEDAADALLRIWVGAIYGTTLEEIERRWPEEPAATS